MSNLLRPWQLPNFVYSPGVCGLHQEIEHFYNYILPTNEESIIQEDAIKRIKDVVFSLWPNANVEVFGSFRTGLIVPLISDVDIVVTGCWPRLPLYELESELTVRRLVLGNRVCVLDKAAVPLVKFTEQESHIKFDVAFNVTASVKAADLINAFKLKFPEMPKLVMVLKIFLMLHGLNEVYTGGISSYALIIMCISFLQKQSREGRVYNCNMRLGMLLLKFLDFYGRKFDYFKYVISVKGDGTCIEKSQLRSSFCENNWLSVLSIEDPITPNNDIARSSYNALHVKKVFEAAFLKLSKIVDSDASHCFDSILGYLIHIPQEVICYRKWIHSKFHMSKINSSMDRRSYEYGVSCKKDLDLDDLENNASEKNKLLGKDTIIRQF